MASRWNRCLIASDSELPNLCPRKWPIWVMLVMAWSLQPPLFYGNIHSRTVTSRVYFWFQKRYVLSHVVVHQEGNKMRVNWPDASVQCLTKSFEHGELGFKCSHLRPYRATMKRVNRTMSSLWRKWRSRQNSSMQIGNHEYSYSYIYAWLLHATLCI